MAHTFEEKILAWSKRRHVHRNYNCDDLLRFTDKKYIPEVQKKILKYRPENILNTTPASIEVGKTLQWLGLKHKAEVPICTEKSVYFIDYVIGDPFWIYIEVDGGIHKKQISYDSQRDDYIMNATGWMCFRFDNERVLDNKEKFLNDLLSLLSKIWKKEAILFSPFNRLKLMSRMCFGLHKNGYGYIFNKFFPKEPTPFLPVYNKYGTSAHRKEVRTKIKQIYKNL